MIEVLMFLFGAGFGVIIAWYILKSKFDIQINAVLNESNIKLLSLQNHYSDKHQAIKY
jgi:hypothetical protein